MEKPNPKKFPIWLGRVFDLGKLVIILAMLIYLVHLFAASLFVVSGESMEPNFHEREYLVVDKLVTYSGNLQRGDVIVFKFPGELKEKYIKRVIGLPGETVEIKENGAFINGRKLLELYIPTTFKTEKLSRQTKWNLGKDEYFVMGDNRENSNDSRVWGPLPKEDLIGKIIYILFPGSYRRKILLPEYFSQTK